jgi:prevent-host-death family protein
MILKNISEAKAELSALIKEIEKGREVLIAKAGKPVAKLIPFSGSKKRRKPGSLQGKITIASDFDELPTDIANAFGMIKTAKE